MNDYEKQILDFLQKKTDKAENMVNNTKEEKKKIWPMHIPLNAVCLSFV